MKLKRLKVKNIFSFDRIDLDFDKLSNVIIIKGEVNGSGENSNGAGKTSILEAINWCLYDKTAKGVRVNDIIRRGTIKCGVELEFIDGNEDCVVVKKTRGKFTRMSVAVNHKKMPYRLKSRLQKNLEKIVGIDFDIWSNSILLRQNGANDFLNGTDTVRKAFLAKIINMGELDRALVSVRKKKNRFVAKLEELQDLLINMPKQIMNIDEYKTAIVDSKIELKKFQDFLNKLVGKRILFSKKSEARRLKLINQRKEAEDSIFNIQNLIGDSKAEYLKAKEDQRYAKFAGKCSQCKQDLVSVESRQEIKKNLEMFKGEYYSLKRKNKDGLGKLIIISNELRLVLNKLEKKHSRVMTRSNKKVNSYRDDIVRLKTKIKEAYKIIEKMKKIVILKKLKSRSKRYSDLLTTYKNAEFILGPKGFRTIIMKDLCRVIESVTNYYLDILTDGLSISIGSGTRLEIFVRGLNGDMSWESYSGGERKIVEVANSLALAEIVASKWSRFNFLLWDEPFISLDKNKMERVLSLLSDLAHVHGMKILLTTNQAHIVDYARVLKCSEILVRNNKGISELIVRN